MVLTGGIRSVEGSEVGKHAQSSSRDASSRSPLRALERWWPAFYGAVVGAVLFGLTRSAMPDDAMITLSFARNLVEHGQWAITHGLEVNTATSPLTVWVLAALYSISFGHPIAAAGMMTIGCLAVTAMWMHWLAGRTASVIGPLLLASSPFLTAAVGMETFLCVVVLLGAVRYAEAGRWKPVAVAVGAAPLTRPDLLAGVVAVVVVYGVLRKAWRPALVATVAGCAVASLWFAFCWWRFGSAFPLTLPVKAAQSGWGPDGTTHLANSLGYFLTDSPVATSIALSGLVLGVAAVALALDRRWIAPAALALGGATEFVALSATATTPIVYYPGPFLGAFALALALVAARISWLLVPTGLVLVAGVVYLGHHVDHLTDGYHPLRQNWATNAQYSELVAKVPDGATVATDGEIGAVAYYCADRCRVVDPFLADPGRVDRWVAMWRAEHPWADLNWSNYRAPAPVRADHRFEFTFPARDVGPDEVAMVGGLWMPVKARLVGPVR